MILLPDVFHVATQAEWDAAQVTGSYARSTRGLSFEQVGFVHCSFAWQVGDILEVIYATEDAPLVLLGLSPAGLPVKVESGFPHVYAPLPVSTVHTVVPVGRDDAGWVTPPVIALPWSAGTGPSSPAG